MFAQSILGQASTYGHHILHLREVVRVEFWLSRLHGKCVLKFFDRKWPFCLDNPSYDLLGKVSLVWNLGRNALYRTAERVVIGLGAQGQSLERHSDSLGGYFSDQ